MRLLGLALAAAAILAAIIVLHGHFSPAASRSGTGPLDSRIPTIAQPAPDFVLQDLQGHAVKLSALQGQTVLVNFWATWCIPCRDEMPAIAQVYAEQRSQGFTVLEVNEQETPADVRSFLGKLGQTPPVVLDSSGAVLTQYRFKGLPDSVVIDPRGTVRNISYGPLTRDALLRDIANARAASAY